MDLEHERILTETVERSKSNSHRLKKVEDRQDHLEELVTTVKVLATRQETMESDIKKINGNVEELIRKPGKRWESIVEYALLAVVGGILLYILARLGF